MPDAHLSFKQAVEARDLDALEARFTKGAVLYSPVRSKPFEGREAVMTVLSTAMEVFQEFTYTDVLAGDNTAVLFFKAKAGDREVEGADYLRFDSDGLISVLTVIIRPLASLNAVAEHMGQRLAGQ